MLLLYLWTLFAPVCQCCTYEHYCSTYVYWCCTYENYCKHVWLVLCMLTLLKYTCIQARNVNNPEVLWFFFLLHCYCTMKSSWNDVFWIFQDPVGLYVELEHLARQEILSSGGSLSHHHGVGKIRQAFLPQVTHLRKPSHFGLSFVGNLQGRTVIVSSSKEAFWPKKYIWIRELVPGK